MAELSGKPKTKYDEWFEIGNEFPHEELSARAKECASRNSVQQYVGYNYDAKKGVIQFVKD